MNSEISNAQLNAFIDNELDVAEKDQLFTQIQADTELASQVCDLRAIKELVRHGYAKPPEIICKEWAKKFTLPKSLAAGIMLALGLGMGWMMHDLHQTDNRQQFAQNQSSHTEPSGFQAVSLAGVTEDTHKLLMHIDSADPAKYKSLLDDIDKLTQHQAALGQPIQVEVIASQSGLGMLRTDVTPYAQRISTLEAQHPNVKFVACNQSIQRLSKSGVKVKLLPNTQITPNATEEVVQRLHDGWSYIKV
jgi:intracellular sulfur oxidation DsrE/DsrF family protein